MWLFKKKEHKEQKSVVTKHVVKYREEMRNVGKTLVKYSLVDGRKFSSFHYGEYFQHIEHGDSYLTWSCNKTPREPRLSDFVIVNSLNVAQNAIKIINADFCVSLVDDINNPKKSVSGKVVAAEIGKTEPYEIVVSVAYLAERES